MWSILQVTKLFLMEKTLLGTKDEWNPFQIYPTNLLQLCLEFFPAVFAAEPLSKLMGILDRHRELLGDVIGVDIMYESATMAKEQSLFK